MMSARIVHGYTGLFFCAILAFLSGTGTLSVFSVELDWLMRAEMRVAADGNKAPVGQSLDAALAAAAGVRPIALMRFPGARFADRVLVASDDAGRRFVWVDPYSGQVRGTTPTATLKETLRELHRGLSTKARLVQVAVAALSLPLALSVISGLVLYRRFWTGFFRMPRRTGSRRALLSDLHRLTAVWSLPFLAIVVITSAVFLSEMVGFGPPMRPMPRPDPIRAEALPPGFGGAAAAKPQAEPFGGRPSAPFAAAPVAAAPPQVAISGSDAAGLLEAICRGAGLPPGSLANVDLTRTGEEIGRCLRIATEELMALLGARAAAKQFVKSASRTMIGGLNNSPLKFKPNAVEAMLTMFVTRPESYLSSTVTFQQGFDDIKRHQTAVYAAMQPALARLLEDLSPESIEERTTGGLMSSKKTRAWETYVERWDAKTRPHENGMLDVYLAAFADAYDDAVRKTGG